MKSCWWDIEMRGRRLEGLSKRMTTEFNKALNNNEVMLALAYIDRIARVEIVIRPYVEEITGLKKLIKSHDNPYEVQIRP